MAFVTDIFRRAGLPLDLGNRLWRVFRDAGLPQGQMFLHHRIEGPTGTAICQYLAKTNQSRVPMAAKLGIDVDPAIAQPDLAAALEAESEAQESTLFSPTLVGAWSRVKPKDLM